MTQGRLVGPMRRHLFLVPLVIAATAIVLALAVRPWPSDDLDAGEVLANSQAAEERVISQLTEGKALYLRDEAYRRHGPAASTIDAICSEWCLPERYVQELWLEPGPEGNIIRVRGWVKSETGELLQDIATAAGQVITRDLASGTEFRTPLRLSVDDIVTRMRMSADFRAEQVRTDSVTITGYDVIGTRATIMLDEPMEPPAAADNVGEGYSIPYVEDVNPVEWLRRTAVDKHSFLPMRWSVITLDQQGEEYVLETKTRVAFEVVDRDEIPGIP